MDEVERWAKDFRARLDGIDVRAKQRKFFVEVSWFVGFAFAFFMWFYAKEQVWVVVEPVVLSVIVGTCLILFFSFCVRTFAAFVWALWRKC